MIPPRKPKAVREMTFTVHCQKCGHGIILASGYVAEAMTPAKVIACLKSRGWQFAPKILCRSCACPMEFWQMKKAEKIKAEHSDQEFRHYWTQVREHYPGQEKAVDRWLETIGN